MKKLIKKLILTGLAVCAVFVSSGCTDLSGGDSDQKTGSLSIGVLDRSVFTAGIDKAVITVTGSDFTNSISQTAVVSGGAATATVENIPVGKNRVITVQAFSGDISAGDVIVRAVKDINSGNNSAEVNWSSSVKGNVYAALLSAGVKTTDLTSSQMSQIENAIPSDTHATLIDSAKIASDYKAGSLSSSSSYKLTAGSVKVTANSLSGCTIQVNDPLSAVSAAVTSDSQTVTISNVAPGTWKVYAVKSGEVSAKKSVTVTAGSASEVELGTSGGGGGGSVEFTGIQIQVLKSSGCNYVQFYNCDGDVAKADYPGVEMDGSRSDIYYVYDFPNATKVGGYIHTNGGSGSNIGNFTLSAAGSYIISSGGTSSASTYIAEGVSAPTVTISPDDGSELSPSAGQITVAVTSGNDTEFEAGVSVTSGSISKSYTYSDFSGNKLVIKLSDLGISNGASITVKATAENSAQTVTKSASYTTPAAKLPSVSITPESGSSITTSKKITIKIDDGNTALTAASVKVTGVASKTYSLSDFSNGSLSIAVSDLTTEGDKTINVSATATNSVGTCSAVTAAYTTVEGAVACAEWNNLRIYQVMVESFQDGDSKIGYQYSYGPSTTYNYYTGQSENTIHGGDLQGIINAADYIESLGVNAIWLTPIFDSVSGGSKDTYLNSTGYFTYDYFNVDPNFGTNDTFKTLVETFHDKGIAVILDGVFGHWGSSDAKTSPNGNTPVRNNGQYKACAYPASLPFFEEVAEYWIKNYQIDGWRFDQCYQVGLGNTGAGNDASNISDNVDTGGHNYWYEIRTQIGEAAAANKKAGKTWGTLGYTVGEHWYGDNTVVQKGSVNPGANGTEYGLQSCFDFDSRYQLVKSLATQEGITEDNHDKQPFGPAMAKAYADYETKGFEHPEGFYPNLFFTNHDLVRYGNLLNWEFGIDPTSEEYWKRSKLMLAVLAGYTGPITIYYGDEWGAYVKGYTSAGSLGAYNDNMARSNGKISGFTDDEQSSIDYATSLMNMRASHEALWNGTCTEIDNTDTLYVCKKTKGSENIIIAFNNGTSAATFTATGKDLLTGESVSGTVSVPALSARFILVQ